MTEYRLLRVLLLALMIAMPIAACGGGEPATSDQPTDAPAVVDDGGGDEPASEGNAEEGKVVFTSTCATCHGPDATGLPNLGKNLHDNAFVAERTDDEMVEFLKEGRPASHELNTTGVDMPPKGGNPALQDDDLYDVVAYLRTLNQP